MKIFLANLQHAARTGRDTTIGAGIFTADECQAAADTIRDMTETLARCVNVMEHRCPEASPLPDARAILARVQS